MKEIRRWRIELLICEVEVNAKDSGRMSLNRQIHEVEYLQIFNKLHSNAQ